MKPERFDNGDLYDCDNKKRWPDALCQEFWTLYMNGMGFKRIVAKLFPDRTVNELKCKRWKTVCGGGREKAGHTVVYGPDRRGLPWSEHDVNIIKLAKEADDPVPYDYLAQILGRDVKELEAIVPRRKKATFF